MGNDVYTEDLAEFGSRERHMAAELLAAVMPDNFSQIGVKVAMNKHSGYVFLVNEDYQCAMMNDNTMEIYHNTPYEGHEGFLSDLVTDYEPDDLYRDDAEYIKDNIKAENLSDIPEAWQRYIDGE